jgi:hypothetical protein
MSGVTVVPSGKPAGVASVADEGSDEAVIPGDACGAGLAFAPLAPTLAAEILAAGISAAEI